MFHHKCIVIFACLFVENNKNYPHICDYRKNMFQEILIDTIRKRMGINKSLIDEIAGVLDISYDAAHRRISMKSKFSIEEAVQLANHYGLSMDKLFQGSDSVLVRKTKDVQNFGDLTRYLESSFKYLTVHDANRDTALFYSAKDIPL